ncbi:TRAP transporter substrate-binding protein [Thalassobius vesicularis]|uniref:TRAP transporter substrate-binding protein n=1 Tax=Thalassobius vesicularis TaxID=1294297 RepID=A0A4S3MDV3_9RHOB|nr:TRAP transporter substrate-binding protein [Thalassobius vesicularis]THD76288.1 TRAP transporter substrate-binding protein [Thalassobius vesicularis]
MPALTNKLRRRSALALGAAAIVLAGLPAMAQEYVARIGHLESPQQSRHIHLEKVAALVAERTGGAVEFQIFPQGQLGNQRQMTEGVQLGTLEATVSPAAFLGGFNPAVSVLDIPYLMPADDAKAQALREGPFGQALLHSFDTRGVVGVALWPNGKKNFTSNKPLADISDFADQKFRVMDSKILIEQFNALGASAIALPFGELYTSLQTGVVDGQENPLDTILRMKFHEVQDYLVVSEHGAMEDVVLFNPMFWEGLPEDYRKIIVDAFSEVVPELISHKATAVAAALKEIEASDINVRVASDDERAALRAKMYEPAKAAYIERAGDEGAALMATYEAQVAN